MAMGDHPAMTTFVAHEFGAADIGAPKSFKVDQQLYTPSSPGTPPGAAYAAPLLSDGISPVRTNTTMPRRTRKFHKKVRTGCLTCKIRHKRCDETKPDCYRCTSTGRKCDGYPLPSSSTTVSQPTLPVSGSDIGTPIPSLTRLKQTPASFLLPISAVGAINCDNDLNDAVIPPDLPPSLSSNTPFDSSYYSPPSSSVAVDEASVDEFILRHPGSISIGTSSSLSSAEHASSKTHSTSLTHSQALQTSYHKQRQVASLLSASLSRNIDFFSEPITDIESSCFSYFIHQTGPSFASYFDSTFWHTYCANLALSHPVFFACVAALGCVHRRFDYGISREAFEYCAHTDRLVAKAKKLLNELKNQNINRRLLLQDGNGHTVLGKGISAIGGCSFGVQDRDVIMASEMCLGLFEGFQANYEDAVHHMNTSMRLLLDRPMTLLHSETRSYDDIERIPETFVHYFSRAQTRILELLGTPVQILANYSPTGSLPSVPMAFESLEEAANILFTDVEWLMHTPVATWRDDTRKRKAQDLHVGRILRWNVGYAELIRKMERTFPEKTACRVLKWTRSAMFVLLYLVLYVDMDAYRNLQETQHGNSASPNSSSSSEAYYSDTDTANHSSFEEESDTTHSFICADENLRRTISQREELLTNVRRLTVLAEGLFSGTSPFYYIEHSVSFDSAIGPPRHHSKVPESSGKTRHLIKNLMKDSGKEWENRLGVYGVGERVSAIEEHAVIESMKGVIPANIDPKWIDVTYMIEQRRLLLRYCHPNPDCAEMSWTQEWWEF